MAHADSESQSIFAIDTMTVKTAGITMAKPKQKWKRRHNDSKKDISSIILKENTWKDAELDGNQRIVGVDRKCLHRDKKKPNRNDILIKARQIMVEIAY